MQPLIDYIAVFVYFFSVIDPIGTVPVFLAVTSRHEEQTKRSIASVAALAAAGVLLFFVLVGELILSALSIPLSAFQVAGGVVLFLFALSMIFGDSKPEEEVKLVSDGRDTAIFPLAVPSIASPGAMLAAVMFTENSKYGIWEQAQTAMIMLLVLFLAYLCMLAATWIHRFVGDSGASVISRVMGLILASVAMNATLSGLKAFFG